MKGIIVVITIIYSSLLFANEYAPSNNNRIVLYKVKQQNENYPLYSGYYRDSEGVLYDVNVWSGLTDNYLEGSVTPVENE